MSRKNGDDDNGQQEQELSELEKRLQKIETMTKVLHLQYLRKNSSSPKKEPA